MLVVENLTRRVSRPFGEGAHERMERENDTAERALSLLDRGTRELVEAIG
jgi:hypothetical protein